MKIARYEMEQFGGRFYGTIEAHFRELCITKELVDYQMRGNVRFAKERNWIK